jgi:hypothetical protein
MGTVKLKQLPGCDICKALDRPVIHPASADSPTTLGPWGYTCTLHASYRLSPITLLEEDT